MGCRVSTPFISWWGVVGSGLFSDQIIQRGRKFGDSTHNPGAPLRIDGSCGMHFSRHPRAPSQFLGPDPPLSCQELGAI